MRAVRYDQYGPAEVLKVVEIPKPEPGPAEVLVAVHAASVGGGELMIRDGKMRKIIRGRMPRSVGNDFAGRIESVGSDIAGLRVGEAVWGLMPHLTFGSTAEYVAVPAGLVTRAPQNIDLMEAAALPSVGTTVIKALTAKVPVSAGQRLLVRGASGGVGSVAVQLGKALGAHVTALVSAHNAGWVTDLGADVALDYRSADLSGLEPFDVVLDSVGTELATFRRLLAPGGRMVALAVDPDNLVRSLVYTARGGLARSRKVVGFSNDPDAAEIERLTQYVESGEICPVVDRVFPMDDIVAAHRALGEGGVRGKYVIAIGESSRAIST